MKHTLLLLLLSSLVVGQSIDYSVTILDRNTNPVYHRGLQQVLEAPGGVYLYHGFGLNSEESTVSYFDGDSVRQLYQSAQPIELLGATARGAFVRQRIQDEPFEQHILFVPCEGGVVDTLTSRTLQLPHTYQLGEQLLTFSSLGIIAYTGSGDEQILRSTYNDCNCSDSDRFYSFGDQLVFNNQVEYLLTDGTPAGTRVVFNNVQSPGQLAVQDGKLYHLIYGSLEVYDSATGQVTDLTQGLPGIGRFTEVHGIKATDNGLLITATTEAEGRELFITDGTRSGTRALEPLRNGPVDGVVASYTGDYYNSGSFLVFQYNGVETAELWISDGTDRGTFKIVDGGTYDLSQAQNLRIQAIQDSTLQVIVDRGAATGAAVLNVDPRNKEQPTVLVGTLSYSPSQVPLYTLNNRLLIGGSYYSDTLLSFGTRAGDVEEILTFGFSLDALGTIDDILYLLLPDGNEGLGIYATRGRAGDLRLVNRVVADDPYAARVFSIGEQPYAYAFDPKLGDAIYRIESVLSATLVSDLYRNNEGNEITNLFAIGSDVVWTKRDEQLGFVSYSSNGQLAETYQISLDPYANLLGEITGQYYFAVELNGGGYGVSEVSDSDGSIRELPKEVFAGAISDLLLLQDRIYFIRRVSVTFNQQIIELVAVDPLADTSTVVQTDTYTGQRNQGRQYLATDGQLIYFTVAQEAGFGPATYDPATGSLTLLGELASRSSIEYYSRGSRVAIKYNRETFGDAVRLLSPTDVSATLPDNFIYNTTAVGLADAWVQVSDDGRVYGINYSNGSATLLEPNVAPGDQFAVTDFTQISTTEALYIRRTGENISTLWRTDGTPAGTRTVLDLPGDYRSVLPFGSYYFVWNMEGFQLIDLATESLTEVPVRFQGPTTPVVAGNRLYFSAVDPELGEELHYLTVSVNDGPATALREMPSLHLQIYPNPTAGRATLTGPTGQPLQFRLFDLTGRLLLRTSFTEQTDIDLSGYPAGTYLLQIQDVNSGASGVRQLVKQ